MAVISVEVPEEIAKKFNPYVVVSSTKLYEELSNNYDVVIDFWKNWIWKKEFEEYLLIKDSI